MEPEKRCTSSSSSSSYAWEADRVVKTEEIEAAETLADLAQLAMREGAAECGDKWCKKGKRGRRPFTRHSPTPHFASNPLPHHSVSGSPDLSGGQAVAGQHLDEKISTTKSVETKWIQEDVCSRHLKVEQDADLPKTSSVCMTSYSLVHCNKSRRNLTEEEKEVRRIRRVLANRESARQTIRRRQAVCEDLTRKAANLVLENENLKREKELALKEYQSLETTNKHLKAQIAKSINTKVEKTPVEHVSSVAEVSTLSGNSPWFLYNHFPVTQLFWPSIIQSSNPVQLQHTPLNSVAIPSNACVPCASESDSCHQQNNHITDNRTQNPLYMFPCPWLVPLPEFGNGQPQTSIGLKDKQGEHPLGKQSSISSSFNTVANMDYHAALPIKLKTEASGLTEARPINGPGHTTPRFLLDGDEQTTGCQTTEKFRRPSLGGISHASAVKQEQELSSHSAPNSKVSSTASYAANSSLEMKQEQVIGPGKNLVDSVAAAEARKRRKELKKLKSIHGRQSRLYC